MTKLVPSWMGRMYMGSGAGVAGGVLAFELRVLLRIPAAGGATVLLLLLLSVTLSVELLPFCQSANFVDRLTPGAGDVLLLRLTALVAIIGER